MLASSSGPKNLWGDAVLIANYILNRVPNKQNPITPYESWRNRKPNLDYLRIWGCLAYVRITNPKIPKLGIKAYQCVFIGYTLTSKAHKSFNLENNVVIESLEAIFHEDKFTFQLKDN